MGTFMSRRLSECHSLLTTAPGIISLPESEYVSTPWTVLSTQAHSSKLFCLFINIFIKTRLSVQIKYSVNFTWFVIFSNQRFDDFAKRFFFRINNLNKIDIKTASLPPKTICDLLRSSPQQNILSDAGVYCIPCKNCKLKYVGETSRDLHVRLKEHKRDIRIDNINNALLQHISQSNQNFDFNSAKMVIYIHNHIYQPLRSGRIWYKVNF